MLRPQDNATRETKRLDGLWDFAADPDGVGRDQGWWRATLPGARPMPVPSSYNDVLVDTALHDHVGDVWYQRTVFVPRGWEGQQGRRCASTRPRTVPWSGSTTRSWPSTRAATRRSRRTSARWSDPGAPIRLTVVVNNELTLAVAPSRHRRGDARRPAAPAPVPRLLQLRRASPRRVAVLDAAVAHRGRDGDHRARGRDGDRALPTAVVADGDVAVRVELRDAEGRIVARGTGEEAELRVSRRHPVAPGTRLPLRAPGRPLSTGTAWSTATSSPSASGASGSRARAS